ncbi:hypothetical protein B0H11DRAFT_2220977 [Mycena galericulata]|nr:hypothetical protein B0H11DRAFT_2220977 [Mycena galericulata]
MSAAVLAFSRKVPSLTNVPADVLQQIVSWASPCDLQNLRLVSRFLRAFIDNPQRTSIWREAFKNVMFTVALPTTLTTFKFSSLAQLLFGGGKCMNCKRITLSVPYSFALEIRFCSMACELSCLLRTPPTPRKASALPSALPELEHRNTLPVPLPYLEGSSEVRLYAPQAVNAAWKVYVARCNSTPGVMQMPEVTPVHQIIDVKLEHWMAAAEVLCDGARKYRIAKEEVDVENEAFLIRLACDLGYTFAQLISSPTLVRYVNIFARDLQTFTPLAWDSVRHSVLFELDERISRDNSRILCPFCSLGQRQYSNEGLQRHIADCHPDEAPAAIAKRLERCPMCPRQKMTMYDRPSMIKHVSTYVDLAQVALSS